MFLSFINFTNINHQTMHKDQNANTRNPRGSVLPARYELGL